MSRTIKTEDIKLTWDDIQVLFDADRNLGSTLRKYYSVYPLDNIFQSLCAANQ